MSTLIVKSACITALVVLSQVVEASAAQPTPGVDSRQGAGDLNGSKPLPALPSQTAAQANVNYTTAIDSIAPLSPEQILAMRKRIYASKRAASTHPGVPPKPVSSSVTVDLSPGAPPPIVRVSTLGATVNFIDITGAPWDILEVNNMARGRFDVTHPVSSIPSLNITANGDMAEGDMAVYFKGLSFPIVIKMIAGQRETDYRLDVRIPRRGPNAASPVRGTTAIDLPKDYMQSLLDGIEPTGAKRVKVEGGGPHLQAWSVGERIVIRTSLNLSNPAYYAILTAADGTRVYEIPKIPVVTITESGASRNIILDLEQ